VDKREFIQHVIETLGQNQQVIRGSILDKLNSIEAKLDSMNDEELDLKTNMVVTQPDGGTYDPESLISLLEEVYDELEAESEGTNNKEIATILNELKGYLDIPERYFP
jgi:transcription elongation factor